MPSAEAYSRARRTGRSFTAKDFLMRGALCILLMSPFFGVLIQLA